MSVLNALHSSGPEQTAEAASPDRLRAVAQRSSSASTHRQVAEADLGIQLECRRSRRRAADGDMLVGTACSGTRTSRSPMPSATSIFVVPGGNATSVRSTV